MNNNTTLESRILTPEEALEAIKPLRHSQGSYGRICSVLEASRCQGGLEWDQFCQFIEREKPIDIIDLFIAIEG